MLKVQCFLEGYFTACGRKHNEHILQNKMQKDAIVTPDVQYMQHLAYDDIVIQISTYPTLYFCVNRSVSIAL